VKERCLGLRARRRFEIRDFKDSGGTERLEMEIGRWDWRFEIQERWKLGNGGWEIRDWEIATGTGTGHTRGGWYEADEATRSHGP